MYRSIVAATLGLGLVPSVAAAQTAASDGVPDVVVTARLRT
jgi:hypothetical protein